MLLLAAVVAGSIFLLLLIFPFLVPIGGAAQAPRLSPGLRARLLINITITIIVIISSSSSGFHLFILYKWLIEEATPT